jgi:hypothetical protein
LALSLCLQSEGVVAETSAQAHQVENAQASAVKFNKNSYSGAFVAL